MERPSIWKAYNTLFSCKRQHQTGILWDRSRTREDPIWSVTAEHNVGEIPEIHWDDDLGCWGGANGVEETMELVRSVAGKGIKSTCLFSLEDNGV